ncbi:hypothetical protein [uncultured Aquimarina sp.]|uniref:hypothetical protein n=1 Tax=uncultured Aquimarina sp. TaxID=575652 RepID=UPI00262F208A|nr:hypothetical protein [uncultured Aquimarina sp.]
MKKTFITITTVCLLLIGFTSCREKKTTGEKIEDAVEETTDAVEDAADEVGDAVEDATDDN